MLNVFRRTKQLSVYPLISCLLGAWLLVVSQFCVASMNMDAGIETGDTDAITLPCDMPMTEQNSDQSCCNELSPCTDMESVSDISTSIPVVYELSSFDFAFIAYNPPDKFAIPHTSSVYTLYHDPEGANLLPIERFSVQIK